MIIDHIVVGAKNLKEGADYIENLLKSKLSPESKHNLMGTHNKVIKIGDDCYLEVLAIDPHANSIKTDRWFNLDNPKVTNELSSLPRLLGYVVNFDKKLINKKYLPFFVVERDQFKWKFAMPNPINEEKFPGINNNGIMPNYIKWLTNKPLTNMPESNFKLETIEIILSEKQKKYQGCILTNGKIDKLKFRTIKSNNNELPKLKVYLKNRYTNEVVIL